MLTAARGDGRVLGLLLGGSRGKDPDWVTERSDYDVYLVVADDLVCQEYRARFPSEHGDPVELIVMTLEEFRGHALSGSETEFNAYTFAHVTPLLDRLDGEVARLAAVKATRDPGSAARLLDAYLNSYYRSAKNHRDGLAVEAHLDAVEAVASLLDFLFGAVGRVRPYNKWLIWELSNHPLPEPWSKNRLLGHLQAVLPAGDMPSQQDLFREVELFARERGYGPVLDGWQPDLGWLRGDERPHSADIGSGHMAVDQQLSEKLCRSIAFVDGHADLWAVFNDGALLGAVVYGLAESLRDARIAKVAGIEARGFVLGAAVAAKLGVGFVAIRKEHGLYPGAKLTAATGTDYQGRHHELRLQRAACGPGDRVALVDDWFETGSQALEASDLIERSGAEYAGASIIVDQLRPETRRALEPCHALVHAQDLRESRRS